MGYKVESINAEEAKKEIVSFDYALIYMISEVILKRIDELEVINWKECEEARFFSKNKEIHFFREDDTLQAVKVSDNANEDKMDSMQKRYYLASKFRDLGQYVLVKEYLKYDENSRGNLGEELPVLVYRLLEYSLKEELIRRYKLTE